MRYGVLLGLCLSLQITSVWAAAPDRSQRPLPRGVSIQIIQATEAERSATRPAARPTAQKERKGLFGFLKSDRSQRPSQRPKGLKKKAAEQIARAAKGSVCGDPSIKGSFIKPIRGRGACGVAKPVKITSVDGVGLTQHATIDCTTAKALKTWVRSGLKPAVGNVGGGVRSLQVVAHYACRNRNSARSGRLSEHAKGRAIDIAAINLNNGQRITVLKGWRNRQQGPILKRAHKAACGPFGTVLGPNANRFHQDHFHFDTARYRSGSYCR